MIVLQRPKAFRLAGLFVLIGCSQYATACCPTASVFMINETSHEVAVYENNHLSGIFDPGEVGDWATLCYETLNIVARIRADERILLEQRMTCDELKDRSRNRQAIVLTEYQE